MNGWMMLLVVLVVLLIALLTVSALKRGRRQRLERAAREAEIDALRRIYSEGGWHRPAERLLTDERAATERSAGWSAHEDVARLYMPLGLRPTHRDEEASQEAQPSEE